MTQQNNCKIVIMGLGYIGLPTAAMLATKGCNVLGVDIDEKVVATINAGNIHIVEPELDTFVKHAVANGKLKAAVQPESANCFLIAVPTPFKAENNNPKAPDISCVVVATKTIIPYLRPGNLIILESTSPVGTTEEMYRLIIGARPELENEIYVAYCPERVLPGYIVRELVDNDRVIGGINSISAENAEKIYKIFCQGNIFLTDSRTAEMTKLVENSFRDVNIAFANELSLICDKLKIDVWKLIELANKHPRVNILQPGPGVGGHCVSVDPWFIVASAPTESKLIKVAREVNDNKPNVILEKIATQARAFNNPIIGCLGLAFKANIDDLRESPGLKIAREIFSRQIGKLMTCEPNVSDDFTEFPLYPLSQVLAEANILVVLADHDEFKNIDKNLLKGKVIIDTRGIWQGSITSLS